MIVLLPLVMIIVICVYPLLVFRFRLYTIRLMRETLYWCCTVEPSESPAIAFTHIVLHPASARLSASIIASAHEGAVQ
jgi:hypothetical protein